MSSGRDVLVLGMGGTIDKVYTLDGQLEIGPPAAQWLLPAACPRVSIESVVAKDSLDLTDEDRERLSDRIRRIDSGGVVITHGTDTMVATAKRLLAATPAAHRLTIVLTGALQPAVMRDSDASFNLGAALIAAQILDSGVYIVMNGQVLPGDRAVKDPETGRFGLT